MATKLSIPNNNPKKILGIAALIVGAIILTFFIIWLYRILTLDKRNCKRMNRMYSEFPLIKSFNPNNEDFSHNLRDYYIKTAYNCCAPGNYKNSFVNLCALKNCIKDYPKSEFAPKCLAQYRENLEYGCPFIN